MTRKLPRKPPPPLEGTHLEKHYKGIWHILWNRMQMAGGFSPVTVGNAREHFVSDFLQTHLPYALQVGSGHIVAGEQYTDQLDIVVFRQSGLALPVGNSGLFFPESVVACMEVKSFLKKNDFVGQIAKNFRSLEQPQPLKAVVSVHLDNKNQHRRTVAKWALDGNLKAQELPDLIITLDNAAIIRGSALKCLLDTGVPACDEDRLYKVGSYRCQKWLGLMLLIFELAQRIGDVDWAPYIKPVIKDTECALLPD